MSILSKVLDLFSRKRPPERDKDYFYDDDVVRIDSKAPDNEHEERLAVLVIRTYEYDNAYETKIELNKADTEKLMKVFES